MKNIETIHLMLEKNGQELKRSNCNDEFMPQGTHEQISIGFGVWLSSVLEL